MPEPPYQPPSNEFGDRFLFLFFPKLKLQADGIFTRGRVIKWEEVANVRIIESSEPLYLLRGGPTRGKFWKMKLAFSSGSLSVSGRVLDRKDPWIILKGERSAAFNYLCDTVTRNVKCPVERATSFSHLLWLKNLASGVFLMFFGFFLFVFIYLWIAL